MQLVGSSLQDIYQMTTIEYLVDNITSIVVPDKIQDGIVFSRGIDKWERGENERADEYAAFLIYRDLGALQRSIYAAQAVVGEEKFPNLTAVASRNRWKTRAELWDDELVRLKAVANERALIEMGARHATQIQSAAEVLMIPVNAAMKRLEEDPEIFGRMVGMDTEQLLNLMIKSINALPGVIKTERLINGQATSEISATSKTTSLILSGKLSELSDEQLEVLEGVFSPVEDDD